MNNKLHQSKKAVRLTIAYISMGIAVVAAVTIATLFMFGYRLNFAKGGLEQYALMQFDSSPVGATVWVDNAAVFMNTPNKTTVESGNHEITMWKKGYKTWRRTSLVLVGNLSWLNYALFVPEKIKVKSVYTYDTFQNSLATPNRKAILIQPRADTPDFKLVDISGDKAKSTDLTIPAASYTAGTTHTFQMIRWDESGRYVLLKHTYDSSTEWLVLDTQDASATKNLTTMFAVPIDDAQFDGTSGNKLYLLTSSTIRLANISDGTLSKVLVNNVDSFDFCQDTSVITYVGKTDDHTKQVVGIYQDGDSSPVILKNTSDMSKPLHIVTDNYSGTNYIVISEGAKITIFEGDYPKAVDGGTNSLKVVKQFAMSKNVDSLSFSSDANEYILVRSGSAIATYDLEYDLLSHSSVGQQNAAVYVGWLTRNYLYSTSGGKLSLRYFDGTNINEINNVVDGQSVVLTKNNKYLYSINAVNGKYQLQYVKMIND